MKAIPIIEIKNLAFMVHSIAQEPSLTHPTFNFRNKDSGYTLYQRIPLSTVNPCQNTVVPTATQYGIY